MSGLRLVASKIACAFAMMARHCSSLNYDDSAVIFTINTNDATVVHETDSAAFYSDDIDADSRISVGSD